MIEELPVQVDGEPWLQPAGHVVVLRSALKVHIFFMTILMAIEAAGSRHHEAVKLVWELGRRAPTSLESPGRPRTCSSNYYQWLCEGGTRSRFRTRSQFTAG